MELTEEEIETIKNRLHELELEHRDLDVVVEQLLQQQPYHDQLRVQRMKKRKLLLKDMINHYQSLLIPDQPA